MDVLIHFRLLDSLDFVYKKLMTILHCFRFNSHPPRIPWLLSAFQWMEDINFMVQKFCKFDYSSEVIKVAFNCIRIVDRSEITLAPVLILFTLSINWITINPVMLAIKENSCIFILLVIFASFNAKGRLDWSKQILNLVNVLGLQ